MFSIQQITEAHDKVKSGANFPAYIQQIKQFGVVTFETWVKDSHTVYFGSNNFQIASDAQYEDLILSNKTDIEKFKHYLKIHQQGQTDYHTFCQHCAETGIERWVMDLNKMTCSYYDLHGQEILSEKVPN